MTDLEVLWRTVDGEAEGEPFEGKLGVAWSVQNRVAKHTWYGWTIMGVCWQPGQYSCWNAGPDRDRIISLTLQSEGSIESMAAAAAVVIGIEPDPTMGSTHYLTQAAYDAHQRAPVRDGSHWSKGLMPCLMIGRHLFFNNVP